MLIGIYVAEYTGKTMCGFQNGHKYKIEIDKTIYGYTVSGVEDFTEDMVKDACINYASENSVRKNWIIELN